jgi:hypothetical protein
MKKTTSANGLSKKTTYENFVKKDPLSVAAWPMLGNVSALSEEASTCGGMCHV